MSACCSPSPQCLTRWTLSRRRSLTGSCRSSGRRCSRCAAVFANVVTAASIPPAVAAVRVAEATLVLRVGPVCNSSMLTVAAEHPRSHAALRCAAVVLEQAHSTCRQLKQQLLHMDRDLSKAGGSVGHCWQGPMNVHGSISHCSRQQLTALCAGAAWHKRCCLPYCLTATN